MNNPRRDGVACPSCSSCVSHTYDTRKNEGHIWRRRECVSCGERFSTKEVLVVRRGRTNQSAHEEALDQFFALGQEIDGLIAKLTSIRLAIGLSPDGDQ